MIELRSIVVTALALGCTLALVNHVAEPQVIEQQKLFEVKQLEAIIGDKFIIESAGPGQSEHQLLLNDAVVGQLQLVTTFEGYNGEITYWLGTEIVNNQHQVVGVRVTEHDETPGLGDKLELEVSNWVLSFNGRSLGDTKWDVEKYGGDFDQFSGATITPRALVKSVAIKLNELDGKLDTSPNEN